ncbi:Fe-S oxidoreductase [Sphingobium sp. HBC34]|uniref:Fe-S oxidoreductase n=1 Tax=Sphingobium cyanobacteriorum TaxID=3063954 RepID=A0ABT8ZH54_9SPHN|nr:Fe-S oxidoreductase [Sphingobium sp. HBC34]MDO7833512.1 Fe-S oxidoreductase [Sphingobium sp. HBC34]
MKMIMLAGAALLGVTSMGALAIAQDMPAPASQPAADAPPPPPPADPNAGVPTGAVPAGDAGMVPAPAGVPHDPAAPVGSSANPVAVGGNMTPPPTGAKDYPLCSRTVQDSCVNPGEAARPRKRR